MKKIIVLWVMILGLSVNAKTKSELLLEIATNVVEVIDVVNVGKQGDIDVFDISVLTTNNEAGTIVNRRTQPIYVKDLGKETESAYYGRNIVKNFTPPPPPPPEVTATAAVYGYLQSKIDTEVIDDYRVGTPIDTQDLRAGVFEYFKNGESLGVYAVTIIDEVLIEKELIK